MADDYESDFDTASTSRTSPTKSITLPYGSSHHCFTRSYGFYSARTPSSAASENPGKKYLKSSFPDLIETLKSHTKPKQKRSQWLRIEDVVKDTMERYDDYCKKLTIKNEVQQKEIQEKNQKQIKILEKMEEKKKLDNMKKSSYARIWNHHAKMRELAEKLYEEKVEREQIRHARYRKKRENSWDQHF
ncbi:Hypothetical predicted protein [Mytilus galloprovincialis]|uniref:Uncharacterized protein n=1 Tax=Mytilus galloprovincialis TaxID=29158 RepID=A0A8B6FIZ6_MYTGA|nr:Hypothetical predicted protein [Mytilus galloprovincialis]